MNRTHGAATRQEHRLTRFAPLALTAFLLIGCGRESPEALVASARAHLDKKETSAAIIKIKNALEIEPYSGEARKVLGTALMTEGDAAGAEVEFRKALAAGYPQDKIVPELARSMHLAGQDKRLVDEFGATKLGVPTADASLQTTLADAYAALREGQRARAALSAALEATPLYAPALLAGARLKANDRDFDGAIKDVDGIIAREPENSEAWRLKADMLQYARQMPEEAAAAYQKAIRFDSGNVAAHRALVSLLTRQRKFEEAEKSLDQLRRIGGKDPRISFYEAQLAFFKKDIKRARELTQQLVLLAPGDPLVLQLAGAVELQRGSAAQAEILLGRALRTSPQLPIARRLLVVAHLRAGQPQKAHEVLMATTGKDGEIEPSLYALAGEVFLQLGDAKRAEEFFGKALKLAPDNTRNRVAMAIAQLAGGQQAHAIDELSNIAASDAGVTADLALVSAHLRRREFDRALVAVDKLGAKQPDQPMAANLRGRILLAQGNRSAARKSFEQALAIDGGYFSAAASLAALDMAEKKPEEARKRFESVLQKNPKSVLAHVALARMAISQGTRSDEVVARLGKAIDADPSDAVSRRVLIEYHLRVGDTKQALAVAQTAVAAVPASPELLASLGRVQLAAGDVNQAVATYTRLVGLQPLSPRAHLALADAHVANGDHVRAEQSVRNALEIKPDDVEGQRRLVGVLIRAQRFPQAYEFARSLQKQRPQQALGLVLEGDIANAQKDWSKAAQLYRAALALSSPADTSTKLHAVLVAAGRSAEADGLAKSWLASHPKDTFFMAYLGERAIERQDYAAAEKQYEALLAVQPDNALALNNLAWVTGRLKGDGAVAYAERAVALAPDQASYLDTLAMLLAERKELERAIDVQKKAVQLQPRNESLRLNLARIYVKANAPSSAKTELESLIKDSRNKAAIDEAEQLLRSL